MTEAADLIARLIEAGTPAALVAEVARLEARADAAATALEQRRSSDRSRSARRRNVTSREITRDHDTTRDVTGDTPAPAPSPSLPPDPQPNPAPTHTPATTTRTRGARLAVEWAPPEDWLEWAMAERGWSRVDAETEASTFHDHWIAKPGKEACKLDWQATWRNWIRNSRRQSNGQRSHYPGRSGRDHSGGRTVSASNRVFGSMDRG